MIIEYLQSNRKKELQSKIKQGLSFSSQSSFDSTTLDGSDCWENYGQEMTDMIIIWQNLCLDITKLLPLSAIKKIMKCMENTEKKLFNFVYIIIIYKCLQVEF